MTCASTRSSVSSGVSSIRSCIELAGTRRNAPGSTRPWRSCRLARAPRTASPAGPRPPPPARRTCRRSRVAPRTSPEPAQSRRSCPSTFAPQMVWISVLASSRFMDRGVVGVRLPALLRQRLREAVLLVDRDRRLVDQVRERLGDRRLLEDGAQYRREDRLAPELPVRVPSSARAACRPGTRARGVASTSTSR